MNRRAIRRTLILLLALSPAAAEWWVLSTTSFPPYASPTIVVAGDFSAPDSFGHQVYSAVYAASQTGGTPHSPQLHVLRLDDQGDASTYAFRQQFLDVLSREYVVAVVSANTTANAGHVIKLGETFRLPVLVTVATHQGLLTAQTTHTFRLVPNDVFQAAAILNWSSAYSRVVVLWNDSIYGAALSNQAVALIERTGKRVVRVPAAQLIQYAGFLSQDPSSFKPDAIIYIGYHYELSDITRTLRAMNCTLPLLVSDGCYSENLASVAAIYGAPVSLSFPVDPYSTSATRGFGAFGTDACLIIGQALKEAHDDELGRELLVDAVVNVTGSAPTTPPLLRAYQFDRLRENTASSFRVLGVPQLPASRPSP